MIRWRWPMVPLASLLALSVVGAPTGAASVRTSSQGGGGAGVVAVIGETGVNPLHIDFRSSVAPDFPPGMPRPVDYTWVGTQPWIDTTSMSFGELRDNPCFAVAAVRAVHASGRIPFAAAGNTEVSAPIPVSAPNGMSEIYQVGGVDDTGRTWTPRVLPQDPYLGLIAPMRPYETGDDFFFDAPDYNSLDGRRTFGGTSGATPRTAGRAARLIVAARHLLGDTDGGAEPQGRVRTGTRGPLSDGRLARDELVDLLHRTATPAEPASPARHAVEGYGALTDNSMALALRVLRGEAALAPRPDEDDAQRRIDDLRDRLYGPAACP